MSSPKPDLRVGRSSREACKQALEAEAEAKKATNEYRIMIEKCKSSKNFSSPPEPQKHQPTKATKLGSQGKWTAGRTVGYVFCLPMLGSPGFEAAKVPK